MKLTLHVLILMAGFAGQSTAQSPQFAAGRASYLTGQYKEAAAHFQVSLRTDSRNAECNYWLGRSYETLADMAYPFSASYNSKARTYLTKAAELAPDRTDYRQELFSFLLNSADFSRRALPQARAILLAVPETDPEYADMLRRVQQAAKDRSSVAVLLGRLFLAAPQSVVQAGETVSSWQPTRSRPVFESLGHQ